jgi:glutamate mutase epsilon subunit
MEVERIKFERTGGFAGMTIARDLKLDDLSDEQAQRLLELLDDLDFNELPEKMTDRESMPDQFTYVITVETKKGEHTVVTGDESAPEKMQELLKLLNRLARTRKKQ